MLQSICHEFEMVGSSDDLCVRNWKCWNEVGDLSV